ncbi:MAG: gliding motility-associated protein GldE [Bacteroidales bacterium]|nr:gliding motility-associated protein GldE [Bacteroidales bacterium]MBN2819330.1 gliding motility-associated protein GldE [Bacteroidales bacterium]
MIAQSVFQPENFNLSVIAGLISILVLLAVSALVSGSEVAFFSLLPVDLDKLRNMNTRASTRADRLLNHPDKLLATILITNNFVNVGIVVISSFITSALFNFTGHELLGRFIQIVVITFLILFSSEVLPKVYANRFALSFALFTAPWIMVFSKVFRPVSAMLIRSTGLVNRRMAKKKRDLSMDELSDALDLTEVSLSDEKNILKGIVKFGNIYVSEIMRSRLDVVAVDINTSYADLLKTINESGYSRIPVFHDTFDDVRGILYIKDLLPHLNQSDNYNWKDLIRPSFYVPESKKINDLLKEFQTEHIHMAIVVDEYGGTSGIVTMEDILEEIVGEISDESDAEEHSYKRIDDNNFIFEGKVLLNDFYKIAQVDYDVFDDVKGEADTIAGLILELRGEIPGEKDKLVYKYFTFEILEVDQRRIKQIKVTLKRKEK